MLRQAIRAVLVAWCAVPVVLAPQGVHADTLPIKGFASIEVDAAHRHVFMSGGSSTNNIAVFDFAGRLQTMIGGFSGPQGLAVDGSSLFVANYDAATIDQIDTSTLRRVKTFDLGDLTNPSDLVVLNGRVWFTAGRCGEVDSAIAVLDPDTGKVTIGDNDRNQILSCGRLEATSARPETLYAWDVGSDPGTVNEYRVDEPVLDGVTDPSLELVATTRIEDEVGIADLAVSPNGERIVPQDRYGTRFSEYDTALRPVVQYRTAMEGQAIAYSPDGSRIAAAANVYRGVIDIYRPGTSAPEGHISLGRRILQDGLAYSPDGSKLFVMTASSDEYAESILPYSLVVVASTKFSATLTLAASRWQVKYPSKVRLTAHLSGEAHSGEVHFLALRKGREIPVGRARVSSSGLAKLEGVPTRNTTFIARWGGNNRYRPARSNRIKVEVAVRVFGKLFGSYASRGGYKLIHKGGNAVYAAQVAPTQTRGRMYFGVDYKTSYGWRSFGQVSAKVTKRGAGVGLRALPIHRYRISASFSNHDHAPGFSKMTYFQVTP